MFQIKQCDPDLCSESLAFPKRAFRRHSTLFSKPILLGQSFSSPKSTLFPEKRCFSLHFPDEKLSPTLVNLRNYLLLPSHFIMCQLRTVCRDKLCHLLTNLLKSGNQCAAFARLSFHEAPLVPEMGQTAMKYCFYSFSMSMGPFSTRSYKTLRGSYVEKASNVPLEKACS